MHEATEGLKRRNLWLQIHYDPRLLFLPAALINVLAEWTWSCSQRHLPLASDPRGSNIGSVSVVYVEQRLWMQSVVHSASKWRRFLRLHGRRQLVFLRSKAECLRIPYWRRERLLWNILFVPCDVFPNTRVALIAFILVFNCQTLLNQ